MRIGDYVYDITDKQKRNLLVLQIERDKLWVYCMRRNDKFWINKNLLEKTPILWKVK